MPAPFIRLVIPFIAGIWLSEKLLPGNLHISSLCCLLLLAACIGLHILIRKQWQAVDQLFACCLQLLLFSLGWFSFCLNDLRQSRHWFGHHLDQSLLLVAEPVTLPSKGAKSARFLMEVKSVVLKNGEQLNSTGGFLLYLPLDQSGYLEPGARYLILPDRVKPLTSNRNPGSFDFAAYNRKKNIFHQLYANKNQLLQFPNQFDNTLRRWLTKAQLTALDAMDKTIPSPHHQLAKALLIGYREDVDNELLNTYSKTGVVHVIAVSGMHLGLIFMILQRLLVFPENRLPFTRWIKFGLVLAFTWFFAAVAGSAGSIIRAASMFSFILFAKLIRKPLSTIQSISLTAFMLLLSNPNWLWDAGFLLSFAALLSIVLFQKGWVNLYQYKNRLLQAVWELCAVTMAAQVLTIPVCIALFHQMPVYFLPANILAVPLSSLALIGTLLLWVSATAGFTLPIISSLTGYLIQLMNQGIQQISRLPGALISDINWTDSQVLVAYLLIISLSSWIQFRKPRSFLLALLFLTGFFALDLHKNRKQERQELLLVHHLPGKSILTIVNGKTGSYYLNRYSPTRHTALEDSKRIFGIQQLHYSSASLVRFRNETLAIPRSNADLEQQLILNPDYLLISRQVSTIEPLLTGEPGNTLVLLDGSLSENRATEWYRDLTNAGYQVHSTWRDGAYCKEFSGKPTNSRTEK